MVEGVGEVSEERGVQETLLHVAVRVGCADLATFFIDKGNPIRKCMAAHYNKISGADTRATHLLPVY